MQMTMLLAAAISMSLAGSAEVTPAAELAVSPSPRLIRGVQKPAVVAAPTQIQQAPLQLPQAACPVLVGYDACGRPIFRRVSQSISPRVSMSRLATSAPAPKSELNEPDVWDLIGQNVEDPFESD